MSKTREEGFIPTVTERDHIVVQFFLSEMPAHWMMPTHI
jgi:hypothetical protein